MAESTADPARPVKGLEAVPWRTVGGVCGAVVVLLLIVARRYGWHRDELYFLEAGVHHLAWGYRDQPPFTPFVARLANDLAPDNLVVLRTAPALATAATILFGTLFARELGGRRTALVAASVAMVGGFALGVGHLLSTAAFDFTAWMALLWLTARLLRTGDTRWWVAFGGVAGLSMLNKNLAVLLVVALAVGLVLERRWDLLVSPWMAAGAALALLIASPNLWWEASHGWPQIDMARALSHRLAGEDRTQLIPLQVLFAGPTLLPVLWWGTRWLARSPDARPFRPLLWAWPAGLAAAFITGGRPYYVLPLTTVVLLAGVVDTAARGRGRLLGWLLGLGLVGSIPLAVPLLPLSTTKISAKVNQAVAETVGWPQLVDQVAGVVHQLPAAEQPSVVLLAGSYGEAGAIDRFGPARGLPHAYSPHNSYADFRQPTDDGAIVVAVRFGVSELEPYFRDCRQVATVDNGLGVDNEVQGQPIVICRGVRTTWPDTWRRLRFLS